MRTTAFLLTLALATPVAAAPKHKHHKLTKAKQVVQRAREAQAPRIALAPPRPKTITELDRALRQRWGTPEARRAALGLRALDPYPVLVFHERFRFNTLWFAVRLYDRGDYRFERPAETALTIDDGGTGALDEDAFYEQPEPALEIADSPEGPVVIGVSCPEFPPMYRNRPRTPRGPERFPPDVLIGRVDPDGWIVPSADLPSIQAGWRYVYDPFTGDVMRVHSGRMFGPPDAASPQSRTLTHRQLVIRDERGNPLVGARVMVATLPHEPEGVLVIEHEGLRIPIGTSGNRERALTADLTSQPGVPVGRDRVQFAVQAFRPRNIALEPDGIRLLPAVVP